MKSFGAKKNQIPCMDQKVPFWQFFRQGRNGHALLVRPSRIPHRISKILFALGADEFLAMLEGKIRERRHFFKVQYGKLTVCPISISQFFFSGTCAPTITCVALVCYTNYITLFPDLILLRK